MHLRGCLFLWVGASVQSAPICSFKACCSTLSAHIISIAEDLRRERISGMGKSGVYFRRHALRISRITRSKSSSSGRAINGVTSVGFAET